jgi:hypothetical protein
VRLRDRAVRDDEGTKRRRGYRALVRNRRCSIALSQMILPQACLGFCLADSSGLLLRLRFKGSSVSRRVSLCSRNCWESSGEFRVHQEEE